MGMFTPKAEATYTAVAGGLDVACLHCRGTHFWQQRANQSSTSAEFFGVAWASPEALVLTCDRCGFQMSFMPNAARLTRVADAV